MADANAAQAATASSGSPAGQRPTLFIVLTLINMVVVVGIGVMIYLGQKKKEAEPGIEVIARGESVTQAELAKSSDFIGPVVPMETFLVNLAQSRGRKLAKINMEFEVSNSEVQAEIEKVKPRIKDMVIMIVSDKSFNDISSKEGKEKLRDEIRSQVNLFLNKGEIKNVYFTEFILN